MLPRIGFRLFIRRRIGALRDPRHQHRRLLRFERFALRRHPLADIFRRHPRHQQAALHIARHNRLAAVAAAPCRGPRIEPQTPLLLQRAMARKASRREDRFYVALVVNPLARPPQGRKRRMSRHSDYRYRQSNPADGTYQEKNRHRDKARGCSTTERKGERIEECSLTSTFPK